LLEIHFLAVHSYSSVLFLHFSARNCYGVIISLFYYKPLILESIYTEVALAHFCHHKSNCEMERVELQTWIPSENWHCFLSTSF